MTILQSTIRIIVAVLALIYTEGYHISKHYNVCIDPAFTTREHTLIIEGMSVWNTNRIRLEEAEPCNISIVNATPWHERWTPEEHVGYTDFYSNEVVLFPDRCTSDAMFRWVAAHEMGHVISMQHVIQYDIPR